MYRAETDSTAPSRNQNAVIGNDRINSLQAFPLTTGDGTAFNTESSIDVQETLECYFKHVNHIFPVISRKSFETWVNDGNDHDAAFRMIFNAFLCSALHYAQLFHPEPPSAWRGAYWEYLADALSNYGNLAVSTPSLHVVQALTSLAFCVQHSAEGPSKTLSILAVAVRFAYRLNLHHLDVEENLGVEGRMERLRLFWCLYMLDRSTSVRLHLPPMIDDRDLYVLTPKMFSDDRIGLVSSVASLTTRGRLSGDAHRPVDRPRCSA